MYRNNSLFIYLLTALIAIYFAGSVLKVFFKPIIFGVIVFAAWKYLQSTFSSRRRSSSGGYDRSSDVRRRFKFDDDVVVDMPEDALRKEKKNEI